MLTILKKTRQSFNTKSTTDIKHDSDLDFQLTIEEISKAITELKLNKARHRRMASEWTYGNGFFQKKKSSEEGWGYTF